jgi:hypothetical protein
MLMSVRNKAILGSAIVAFNLVWILAARADPGVFDDRIVFGQSAALKGPAAALGLGMRDGILAAFQEANAAGGVHGRKLDLGSGPIKSRDSFWASIVIPSSDGGICDERFVLADASATCATGTVFSIVARQASGGRFAGDLGDHFRDQEWLALA